jgi:hypothetical protein
MKEKYFEEMFPVPFPPPQIPLDLAWDGTRAATVGRQQLLASAVANECFLRGRTKFEHSLEVILASKY